MLPENKRHLRSVVMWGGGVSAVAACASIALFPPLIAVSILLGALLSAGNIYAIVLVSEALTAAARTGQAAGGAARAMTAFIYVAKLAVITAILAVLVIYRLADLIALLAGFTVVLVAHVVVGLGRFTAQQGGDA